MIKICVGFTAQLLLHIVQGDQGLNNRDSYKPSFDDCCSDTVTACEQYCVVQQNFVIQVVVQ